MDLTPYLQEMTDLDASDLFITVGMPISAKINGQLTPIGGSKLDEESAWGLVQDAMTDAQKEQFVQTKECNFAIAREGIGRFRCSAFWQRDMPGMVVRRIVT